MVCTVIEEDNWRNELIIIDLGRGPERLPPATRNALEESCFTVVYLKVENL